MAQKKPWFRPKRVGWGRSPDSWQGWVVTLGVVAAIVVVVWLLRRG